MHNRYKEGGISGLAFPRQLIQVIHNVVRLLRSSVASSPSFSDSVVTSVPKGPLRVVHRTVDGSSSSDWPTCSPPSALAVAVGSSPPRNRRFPKAVRYSVEMEYSRPLGWISRAPDGKFVVRGGGGAGSAGKSTGFSAEQRRLAAADFPRDAHHLIPSSQASVGVRSSLRSEGSGQSVHHITLPHPMGARFRPLPIVGRWGSPTHQVSFSPALLGHAAIPTVYSPRDHRFRTSSPGFLATAGPFLIEDLSSVNIPSSVERSFPSTVSSPFVQSLSTSQQTPSSMEMPSARGFHDPRFRHQFRPIQRIQAEVHARRIGPNGLAVAGPQTPKRPVAALQGSDQGSCVFLHRPQLRIGGTGDSRIWRDGRHIHLPGHVAHPPQYPRHQTSQNDTESDSNLSRVIEVPRVSAIQKVAMTPRQRAVYQRIQRQEPSLPGWYERPLATSSPPRTDRRVARVPPSPVKSAIPSDLKAKESSAISATRPKTVREEGGGSDTSGSDQRPLTYTRDRLIGAVERVRSSGLNHAGRGGQPFRHSAPELAVAAREPTYSTPSPVTTSPRSSPFRASPITGRRARRFSGGTRRRSRAFVPSPAPLQGTQSPAVEADSTYVSDDALRGLDHVRLAPLAESRSRTSVTSGSSGRGSSGQISKHSHSRGDSLQGEIDFTNRSSSSSGFASRETGGPLELQSPRLLQPHGEGKRDDERSRNNDLSFFSGQTPRTTASGQHRSPLDLSVDENYEFDSVSPPLESELLGKLRQFSDKTADRSLDTKLPDSVLNNGSSSTTRRRRIPSGDRGLSDSELYTGTSLYPRPKRPSKYINTEARCAALKEEFMLFRRMRLDQENELESAC